MTNTTEDGRPIGHDGKPCSPNAWRRYHAVIARIEENHNARMAAKQAKIA